MFPAGFETPMAAYAKLKCDTQAESTLTNMQETIMNLCANEYLTDGEIAERLGISIATVRKHMQNIVKRLNCRTQRQAIITWLKRGNGRWHDRKERSVPVVGYAANQTSVPSCGHHDVRTSDGL